MSRLCYFEDDNENENITKNITEEYILSEFIKKINLNGT